MRPHQTKAWQPTNKVSLLAIAPYIETIELDERMTRHTGFQAARPFRPRSFTRSAVPDLHMAPQPHQVVDSMFSSSSIHVAVTETITTPATTFEAVAPDTNALIGFGSIVVLSAIAVWVWANQVVPVSRTKLALSKKAGPVKDYLDELRAADESNLQNVDATTLESEQNSTTITSTNVAPEPSPASNDRAFEQWLFTDWLEKAPQGKPGRQKEPALPILKQAKWNSGDNPVLAASALIMGGVLLTAIFERISSLLG